MKILAKECGLIGNFRDVGTRRVVETPQVLAIRRRVPTDGFAAPMAMVCLEWEA